MLTSHGNRGPEGPRLAGVACRGRVSDIAGGPLRAGGHETLTLATDFPFRLNSLNCHPILISFGAGGCSCTQYSGLMYRGARSVRVLSAKTRPVRPERTGDAAGLGARRGVVGI